MEAIEKEKVSIRNQCIEIAYDELQDYIEFNEIASIAEEQQLIHWKNYLSYIETGYYSQSEVSFEVAIGNWEKIKTLRMPGEEDIRIFKELFSQIYYLADQGDRRVIETVCTDCENSWQVLPGFPGTITHNGYLVQTRHSTGIRQRVKQATIILRVLMSFMLGRMPSTI